MWTKLKTCLKNISRTTKSRRPTPVKEEQSRAWTIFRLLLFLLSLSFVGYFCAHCWVDKNRTNNFLSSEKIENARSEVLSSIQLLEAQPKAEVLQDQIQTVKRSIAQIREEAGRESNADEKQALTQAVGEIENLLRQLNNLNNLSTEQLQIYAKSLLVLAEKELQDVEKEVEYSFFWSKKPLLWIEIAFWGWVGTVLYLLGEIGTYYKRKKKRFIDLTPWYLSTLVRGTFVVFAILLGLTTIKIGFGNAVSFSDAPVELYVFLAGVLGYFNRVAKEQLKIIFRGLFKDAWEKANPPTELTITPSDIELAFEEKKIFKVEPSKEVRWSTTPPNVGTIQPETGSQMTYTAPKADALPDKNKVSLIATSVADSNCQAIATVTFTKDTPRSGTEQT